MCRLRLLKINNVQLSEGPEDLSNELQFLEWHSYPSKSLPVGLQVDQLVELHMANSSIEQLWYGCKSAVNLKIINLSNSLNLSKTPDLTGIPNLKSLILEGCTSLLHLTDAELVLSFLKRKICENSLKFDTIRDVDVYKWDPEELTYLSYPHWRVRDGTSSVQGIGDVPLEQG
ncbi:hypothetical protein NC651_032795 [Populus alba x Populus x berolinensis]|nr:hypothetical protein NC651_032795 [Populus alba x Populus x berolinensis]